MRLKILLPTEIFADQADVSSIVAETSDGSFGLLEHRLDCVAALVPGILTYRNGPSNNQAPVYIAVDQGVLIKTGADVLVSVRQAIGGADLAQLQDAVKQKFLKLDGEERAVRDMVAKMESGFVAQLEKYRHAQ